LFAAPAVVRAQGPVNSVALVIGNSNYRWESPLPNVKRDVPDIAKAFQGLGFKTELLVDLDRSAVQQAFQKFRETARGAKVAAVYFAGHGAYWQSKSFIVPLDVDLANESAVKDLIPVASAFTAAQLADYRCMVFDFCRNNPYDGWRQREAKIDARISPTTAAAVVRAPRAIYQYSTAPGYIALDGPAGQVSPFAAAFLQALSGQSVDLMTLPATLRRNLLVTTEGRQLTFEYSTIDAPFALKGLAKPATGAGADPSRIVELNNAYELSRQQGLYLPPGLIAYRPPSGSPDAHKVGAFRADIQVEATPGSVVPAPAIYVVLSVPNAKSGEVVLTTKTHAPNSGGTFWRYFTATNSGSALAYQNTNGSGVEIKWHDRNSGIITMAAQASAGKQFRFTRLDG
jgi:hypothetical protein